MHSRDKVELKIGKEVISNFKAYSINDDMFSLEDQFSMQLGHPYHYPVLPVGHECIIKINEQLELRGIVDSVELRSNKVEKSKIVSGRDITSLLADSYVPADMWGTQVSLKLEDFVKQLLNSHPRLKSFKVVFGDLNSYKRIQPTGPASLLVPPPQLQQLSHISPGQTYLDALRAYCTARGYVFYGTANNTLVFGYPQNKGKADFKIWHGITPPGGYQHGVAMEGTLVRDVSQQYSAIHVVSQRQDLKGDDLVTIDKSLYLLQDTNPIYKSVKRKVKNLPDNAPQKTYVSEAADDIQDLEKYSELIEKQQSFDAFRLEYVVHGHHQNGINWRSSAIAYVEDEIFKIKGNFLIYSKTFEMSKDSGTVTILRLCTPGSMPNAL